MTLHGSINHVAITVSDLPQAMAFLSPLFSALGYTVAEPVPYKETFLTVNVHEKNGTAINVWEAKEAHEFRLYEPGLHHLAFNVSSRSAVDDIADLVARGGATILDGPAEFPFAHQGYYAVYFLGPDNLKFEVVYMAGLEDAMARGKASGA